MISEAYEVIDLSDDEPSNDKHRRSPNMASTSNNNIVASSYETNFDDDVRLDDLTKL
jgi:hypothetical protein